MMKILSLTCEYLENPVGVATPCPRFSWILSSDTPAVMQTSYHIQVSRSPDFSSLAWDSGPVESDQSHLVAYGGQALAPACRYFTRVTVTDNQNRQSEWSETLTFVTALFSPQAWQAELISGETPADKDHSAAALVRHSFALQKKVKTAYVFVSALGLYELHMNGTRVGDGVLTPGWTEYGKRILFQTYDVSKLLQQGENAAGAMVGTGWYKGNLAGWLGRRNVYGDHTGFILQLQVTYEDGETVCIVTDENWKTSYAPVEYTEIYHGERYDARREQNGWASPGFDDAGWKPVFVEPFDKALLKPQDGVFVKRRETLRNPKKLTTPKGETVLDFGQNLTGWVKFRVTGAAGDVVELSHAEVLDAQGNFYTDNLRSAKQKITYILRGGQPEVYEPHLTFQGFRYIRVDQYPGEMNPEAFEAVVVYSDMEDTGHFECSDDMLNQLERNIRWGMKGNFVDIPTDCPQRDERLGWTGDAQVFIRTACYLKDTARFFTKWLRDMALAQLPNGGVPHVVPDVLTGHLDGVLNASQVPVTGWGDAGVICPYVIYQYYGDHDLLAEQYPSMKAWVDYVKGRTQKLIWNTDFQLGDWVALDAKDGSYFGATPTDLIATAYFAHSTQRVAKAAAILGRSDDAKTYEKLHADIKEAYRQEFFTPSGRIAARTQTSYILSLYFGLTPSEYWERTMNDFVALLAKSDNHMTTGFLGTPYICYALSQNGRVDLAYELLLKKDYPSWLYPLSMGATTIWEHLDGIKPDGSMWSADMNSFNHYAYGAVGDWMYSVIGGLDADIDKPGYKRILIAPRPGGGLTRASVKKDTPYGRMESSWTLENGSFTLHVTIPPNTTALVTLPFCGERHEIGSGTYRFSEKQ